MTVGVGASWDTGASISLYGPTAIGISGGFSIRCNNKTPELAGYPNGMLTWGGINLVRSVNGIKANSDGSILLNHTGGTPQKDLETVIPDENATVQTLSIPNYGTWMIVPKDDSSTQKVSGGTNIDTPVSYALRVN